MKIINFFHIFALDPVIFGIYYLVPDVFKISNLTLNFQTNAFYPQKFKSAFGSIDFDYLEYYARQFKVLKCIN